MAYNSFEELDVWKRACRLAVGIYESLQNCRDYGLKDQMTRAAVSIASNIAEGAERNSKAEYIRFTQATELVTELKEISSMLQGLIKSLTLNP